MNRNYHGSRAAKKNPAPKRLALLLALVLILVGTVGGTVAYLVTHTTPVVNTFTPGKVTCEVEETFDKNVKSNVSVKNTGNVPAYIRAAIVVNWVSDSGDVAAVAPVAGTDYSITLADSGWTKGADGYYYYNSEVPAGGNTDVLIQECEPLTSMEGYHLQVTILASAIQSTPADAVKDAWGMNYSNGTWAAEN